MTGLYIILAIVVVLGLATSTLGTIFVIPAVYGRIEGRREEDAA